MRKLVPLIGFLTFFLLSGGLVSAQFGQVADLYRVGLSEEQLYLKADAHVKGRFTLIWSAWIIVNTKTTDPIKAVGEISLTPLGQWTMAPTNSFALGDPGGTDRISSSGKKRQKPRIRPGINSLFLAFPLASIDLPEDLYSGSKVPSPGSLFDYNQIIKITLSLRRSGYWGGVPPLTRKKYELRPLGYALLDAAGKGDVRAVKDLLDKGADVDSATVHNWTALMEAASQSRREVVKLLLDHGARVNVKRKGFPFVLSQLGSVIPYGETALMAACSAGDPEIVRLLIANGAAINTERNDRWTALQAASLAGHNRIVRMLLAKGARVDIESELGYSPSALADINGNGAVERMLKASGSVIRVPWDTLSH